MDISHCPDWICIGACWLAPSTMRTHLSILYSRHTSLFCIAASLATQCTNETTSPIKMLLDIMNSIHLKVARPLNLERSMILCIYIWLVFHYSVQEYLCWWTKAFLASKKYCTAPWNLQLQGIHGWLEKWKLRHNIQHMSASGESGEDKGATVDSWKEHNPEFIAG